MNADRLVEERPTAPLASVTPGPSMSEHGTSQPWALLHPFVRGSPLGLGWVLESVAPIESGAATLVLRHPREGVARVAIHRNTGEPRGVAHTEQLDFLLLNDGGGREQTAQSVGRVLRSLAARLGRPRAETDVAMLAPHGAVAARASAPSFRTIAAADLEAELETLTHADGARLGLGRAATPVPGHADLRVLNLRGAGACDSDCLFCVEKWAPEHRARPRVDATRKLIESCADRFDLLFFASGEPTIDPKLFEHVASARSAGFTRFGMSSHFRTFADPRKALEVLRAGFQFFDISLHAADADTQLAVNPIDDGGHSLIEALKGLGALYRLADLLGVPIGVTHKIVVSRLNVDRLEAIFHATYDRGVRHFVVQPVRTGGLDAARAAQLELTEEEMLPHLNDLLRRTESLGASIKPYGFSRDRLFAGDHVDRERNRVKNVYGSARGGPTKRTLPVVSETTADGRPTVELDMWGDTQARFVSDGGVILDEGLRRGLALPFGCRMGSCGMCAAKVIEGRVDQTGQIFLSEDHQRRGYVLLCQARARTDVRLALCTEDEVDQL